MGRDIDSRDERPLPVTADLPVPEEPARDRQAIRGRGYVCHIHPQELETLRDIGRFRTIAVADLARIRYQGNTAQMEQNLRSLKAQNLVQRRTLWTGGRAERLVVVVLSPSGKTLLQEHGGLSSPW